MSVMDVTQSPPSGQCISYLPIVMDMNQHTRYECDTVHQKRILYIISSFHRFTKLTFSKIRVPMSFMHPKTQQIKEADAGGGAIVLT